VICKLLIPKDTILVVYGQESVQKTTSATQHAALLQKIPHFHSTASEIGGLGPEKEGAINCRR
jgi:hypothetical protein